MPFYKIEVKLNDLPDSAGQESTPEISESAQEYSKILLEKDNYFCHAALAVKSCMKKSWSLCAAVRCGVLEESVVADFLSKANVDFSRFVIEEITLASYFRLARSAVGHEFISDWNTIADKLGISALDSRRSSVRIKHSEAIFNTKDDLQRLLAQSAGRSGKSGLPAEINRIFQGRKSGVAMGHPVHYCLQYDNSETRTYTLQTLLSVLYKNERLKSRRYCQVFMEGRYLDVKLLGAIYESCNGGTVVITHINRMDLRGRFTPIGNEEYADNIEELCAVIRKMWHNVLTVLCLGEDDAETKAAFLKNIGSLNIVSIRDKGFPHSRAQAYLCDRAEEHGIDADEALCNSVKSGRRYTAADLNLIFDRWYDNYLKNEVYPQYADMGGEDDEVCLETQKADALDELNDMTGLKEAKTIINQAIDFHKARMLFGDRGFAGEKPSMHMVFTGNPGTAKTTVARLFARIMKERGLLSAGKLYETGRADLVGKYLGHTAQLVKEKFKAARGSVLFIDEAYSLVDDRDGLYGDEAINTIVQEMENHRDDVVVILAGYPDKMELLLQKNPGLRSRIAFHIPFADYTADELCQITESMAAGKNLRVAEAACEKLRSVYAAAIKERDFGNGRFARTVIEKAVFNQATRLLKMDTDRVSDSDIATLLAEDFEIPVQREKQICKIGFAYHTANAV